ncbi:MAG: MFS transporter [Chloroflexi bacterium]|nr:MFS transporter [Chloroflexota bacterium]
MPSISTAILRARPALLSAATLLLAIEFLDELIFGAREASWPLIRDDLGLTYTQIGLLLAVPNLVSAVVEPGLGLLSDTGPRRAIIAGGGAVCALALALAAVSGAFVPLLLAFSLLYPASGAFVSIGQAELIAANPGRHEQVMARWTAAGSVGALAGPLVLGGAVALGFGWRGLSAAFAVFSAALACHAWRTLPCRSVGAIGEHGDKVEHPRLPDVFAGLVAAMRRREVWRWLVLLAFSELMLDVLLGFLALYLVDDVQVSAGRAGFAVVVWIGVGLLGDIALVPLLDRVAGLAYLRVSAVVMLLLYPAFLLLPGLWLKLAPLALMGVFNAGWYAILQAQLYAALPGRSGTAVAISSAVAPLAGTAVAMTLGLVAAYAGIGTMMWLLAAGPVALIAGLPRKLLERKNEI